jgi:hypothetical protein
MPEAEQPPQPPKPRKKGVMGSQRSGRTRESFLRELKRAARGRLDRRSPQK